MAVTLSNADKALKNYYLDAVAEQLNTKANPLLSAIGQTTDDVFGKEIRKLAIYGINGGIGAGTEDGDLPDSVGNNYEQFVVTLKNLYGTIEISDKAVRASENSSGAFVSLLNAEMEGLLKASSFNFGRMLFGDGSGKLCAVESVADGLVKVDSVKNLMEGMRVDIRTADGVIIDGAEGKKILSVDRVNKTVKLSGAVIESSAISQGSVMTVQGSFNNEITGLGAIFGGNKTIYGLDRTAHNWLNPYVKTNAGEVSESLIQTALDTIEENSGSAVNFIVCSWGVRRALQNLFASNRRTIDTVELAGGYRTMSYNGIPVVADRFCPEGTMYLLNTADFTLHQLCDWQWLEGEDGKVLKQIAGKPVYNATLVKYADLICARPIGQGMISGITEA
jgi:hypothetical protein